MARAEVSKQPPSKQPVAYLQTHWDREWYQPFRAYQVRLAQVVDAILDRLDAGVFPCFMLDGQTVLLDDYLALRPQQESRLRALVEAKKLTIGPWFVMPDELLVGGESLLRNLQYGIRASRAYGQKENFCGYLPDTFGHSADMPTILSMFAIDTAILWRGVSPKYSAFWWQSPAGKKSLGYFLADGYLQMMLHMANDDADLGEPGAEAGKAALLKALSDKLCKRANLAKYLLPLGGDHLGPLDENAMALLKTTLPGVDIETPDVFLNSLRPEIEALGEEIETINGELVENREAFLLPGVYSSRMYLKQQNRMLEHALIYRWEPLQALVKRLSDSDYGLAELELAWHTLLLNHPHDSICGCSVDEVHAHNEVRFAEVQALYDAVAPRLEKIVLDACMRAENRKSQKSKTNSGGSSANGWLMFNTLGRPFSGVLNVQCDTDAHVLTQLEKTQTVLCDGYLSDFTQVPLAHKTKQRHTGWIWVDEVPSLGFCAVDAQSLNTPAKKLAAFCANERQIENEFYRVELADDGTLSVRCKNNGGQASIYKNLHRLQALAQQGDSYNAAPVPGALAEYATLTRVEPWQSGPLVAGITVYYDLSGHAIQSRIWLEAGHPMLFFESTLTNTRADYCLQAGFETASAIQQVRAEGHFSTPVRHYDPHYDISAQMPAPYWQELKTNTGPIQRYLSANGQVFLTQGLAEYEVSGDTMRLTLLRAFGMLSKADTGVRGAQAGPPLPTPGGQCLGRNLTYRYAWGVDMNYTPSDLAHLAQRFYGSITAIMVSGNLNPTPRQLLSWDNPLIVYTALYPQENNENAPGRLLVRLLNTSDKPQHLVFSGSLGLSHYQPVDGLGEVLPETLPMSLARPLAFTPFELKTLCLFGDSPAS